MSAITYIALREIEKTGYAKAGTDISVAATDDSFNATSTNLSGLLNDEWFLVVGYVNAVNNGWFQASANSTSTKISQDLTTALVTEAAGPQVSIVGYQRGLGESYDLQIGMEQIDRSVKVNRNAQHPIGGGAPEVLFHSRAELIDIRTDFILEAEIKQWREFLASVEAGESFTFDQYGTIAAPVEPRPAILENADYSEARVATTMKYRLSLRIRMLP